MIHSLAPTLCQLLDKMLLSRTLHRARKSQQKGLTFDYLNLASELIKTPVEIPAMCRIHQSADPPLVNLEVARGFAPFEKCNH